MLPAACSPTSGYEQTPQIHISTSTRLQCAFKHAALDALDTLKLLSNVPSNAPSVRPQTRLQTRPQCALNAPSKGSNVLSMHPQGMSTQPVLRQKLTSIIPLPCSSDWNALLSARRLGTRHDVPRPLAPHHWMPPTPVVPILGQHRRSLPSACPMTHWTPLLMVRVEARSLLILRMPVTHPILRVFPCHHRSPPSARRHRSRPSAHLHWMPIPRVIVAAHL